MFYSDFSCIMEGTERGVLKTRGCQSLVIPLSNPLTSFHYAISIVALHSSSCGSILVLFPLLPCGHIRVRSPLMFSSSNVLFRFFIFFLWKTWSEYLSQLFPKKSKPTFISQLLLPDDCSSRISAPHAYILSKCLVRVFMDGWSHL